MNTRTLIVAAVAVSSLAIAVWWALSPGGGPAGDSGAPAVRRRDDGARAARPQDRAPAARRHDDGARAARPQDDRAPAARRHDDGARAARPQDGAPAARRQEGGAPAAPTTEDARAARRQDADAGLQSGWKDPTNDRVLGSKEWMASVDAGEETRIDEVFEESRKARHDPRLPDASRAESIAVVKSVVDRCFDALVERVPTASGRLILAWEAGATGGVGSIENVRIKVNYKLEDEQFETCIFNGVQGLTFRGADGDSITVEAPFFYDGSF